MMYWLDGLDDNCTPDERINALPEGVCNTPLRKNRLFRRESSISLMNRLLVSACPD